VRVALVTSFFRPVVGGIEAHVEVIARGLALAGAEVSVVCLAATPTGEALRAGVASCDGYRLERLAVWRVGPLMSSAGRVLNRRGDYPEVVHVHGLARGMLAMMARDLWRIPWAFTPHGSLTGRRSGSGRIASRGAHAFDRAVMPMLLRTADAVIALSEEERSAIARLIPTGTRQMVLGNPLPAEAFEAARSTGGESGRLLFLGRLAPEKRLLLALGTVPGAELDVAGPDQGMLDELQRLATIACPGRVHFLGPVSGEAKRELLRAARAVVLPSARECQPIVALEAFAQGTPVIASADAAAGLGPNGVVRYPTGDVAALGRCIERLWRREELAQERAAACEARSTIPAADEHVRTLLNLYERMLSRGSGRATV
jgi:glycosyltransferase involved in cell wall biosynthesis